MRSFLGECKITNVSDAVATGTTTISSSIVDMADYESVAFVANVGASAVDIGIKAQQDTASNMAGAADLEGSKQLLDGTQKYMVLEIIKPAERYVRCQILRATTCTIGGIWAIQFNPRTLPITNTSAALAAKTKVTPNEGTA